MDSLFRVAIPLQPGAVERLIAEVSKRVSAVEEKIVSVVASEPCEEVKILWQDEGFERDAMHGWTDADGIEHPWMFPLNAMRMVRKHRPDIATVHFGNEMPAVTAALMAKMCGFRKVKWVWIQDQQVCDPGPVERHISRLKLVSVVFDRLVAVYDGGKRAMLARGVAEKKVSVIHNGSIAPHPAVLRSQARESLGIGEKDVMLVSVSSLIPRKRVDFLLTAFADIVNNAQYKGAGSVAEQQVPGTTEKPGYSRAMFPCDNSPGGPSSVLRLLIVGDGAERSRLESLASELGISQGLRFLGRRSDVADLLNASDVFLLASESEGCVYALTEAMAASLPVVVTDAGAAREQAEDGVTGYVVGRDDMDGFVARVKELIEDPEKRVRMGRAGRERWSRMFRLEEAAGKYVEMYKAV